MKKNITDLRINIDSIDTKILKLISDRIKLAGQIGKLKNEQGIVLLDQHRKNKVLKKWIKVLEKTGISEKNATKLYKQIHDFSISFERKSS